MHVELLPDNCAVRSRSFTSKDGKPMEVHEQSAYLWMPGAPYPMPFTIPVQNPSAAYAPGTYVFAAESVRTNNFGQLEFNRFGMQLVRANVADSKASDKPRAVGA